MSQELFDSCREGNLDKVKELLTNKDNPTDIHATDKLDKNALILASCHNHYEIVKYLLTSPDLKETANIHATNYTGKNALIWACINGNTEMVKFLLTSNELKEKAEVNYKDKHGWDALTHCVYHRVFDIVKYLIVEQNVKVDNETMEILKTDGQKEILELINIRNLRQRVNNANMAHIVENRTLKLKN